MRRAFTLQLQPPAEYHHEHPCPSCGADWHCTNDDHSFTACLDENRWVGWQLLCPQCVQDPDCGWRECHSCGTATQLTALCHDCLRNS